MGRPQFISPPQDLRKKAVNFKTGVDVNLTPDTVAKLEAVIAASGDTFAQEVADKLREMRATIAGVGRDDIARMFILPTISTMALDIKGMGGTFGYPLLTLLAKSLHDFLAQLSMPNNEQFEVVSLHIDSMYLFLVQQVTGGGGSNEKTLIDQLQRAIAKVAPADVN